MDNETSPSQALSIARRALELLPYTPLPEQGALISMLCEFAVNGAPTDVFVLNGYAGTGKTSVMGAVIKALGDFRRKVVVLAPTGRAAKVAGLMAAHKSSTIHKRLFHGNSADPSTTAWYLARNTNVDTLFIVDEASLIPDAMSLNHSLLHQLINHVYSSPGCRMALVGDLAQLPPVGQTQSSAMNADRLRQLGLNPISFSLDLPVRQKAFSGILHNATMIRSFLFNNIDTSLFRIDTEGYNDVQIVYSDELDDTLTDSYADVGQEETLIITRSNRRANNFNRAIRNLLMDAESPLQSGDRLIISKNDYFWSKINKLDSFIANGDVAVVNWVGSTEKMYGRWFTETELYFPADDITIGAKVMLRSLVADGPSIPRKEMERLYNVVLASCEGELSNRIKHTMEDPYYNALQAKYAYCVTCHKAQGGQWKHIYIDMGAIDTEALGPDFFRWLYTAFTRATQKVFLINPSPKLLDIEE